MRKTGLGFGGFAMKGRGSQAPPKEVRKQMMDDDTKIERRKIGTSQMKDDYFDDDDDEPVPAAKSATNVTCLEIAIRVIKASH